ncbi:1-aminocyclopropane-1-carboxylate deaminase/D-cysteine desulfhydrase [uncultured Campylobacter sp.]|uniref:1-aminocyclopropane-1-carboxylate deaminase/D-cysteine desulfhydrase n=1 Tax=uncultured Campylobacter sp. TaxID=218934 RepID=UPI002606E0EB|nr:1-aminocyclopropane-1-carboxylate deaminase/D-cysteine desulfhydrase [uncultured Campylobacter sp.]
MKNFFISKIDKIKIGNFSFYVKRDDLLGVINGNKARKLAFFMDNEYQKGQKLISYGSSQSNALAALSIFCKQRSLKFIFVCEKISSFLKQNPQANYALALENEALIFENLEFKHRRDKALNFLEEGDIFIEEGIAVKEAEYGLKILAKEIQTQSKELGIEFDIFLPSGTGTSAAFLAKNSDFNVYTCACVADEAYLKLQISALTKFPKNLHILSASKKFHFAKPYKELFHIYNESLKSGIEFDLLYDCVGLLTVLENKNIFKKPLLYIHQGGLLGNSSMLKRYIRKGF